MDPLPLIKPAYGSRCNGCGQCCQSEVCKIGLAVNPTAQAPCEFLTQHDGRFWCGLVEKMAQTDVGWFLKMRLGIGVGCDAEWS
jgi:hypothetical protein